jgi:hypothetical protein
MGKGSMVPFVPIVYVRFVDRMLLLNLLAAAHACVNHTMIPHSFLENRRGGSLLAVVRFK